jgi:hypothetical protein
VFGGLAVASAGLLGGLAAPASTLFGRLLVAAAVGRFGGLAVAAPVLLGDVRLVAAAGGALASLVMNGRGLLGGLVVLAGLALWALDVPSCLVSDAAWERSKDVPATSRTVATTSSTAAATRSRSR